MYSPPLNLPTLGYLLQVRGLSYRIYLEEGDHTVFVDNDIGLLRETVFLLEGPMKLRDLSVRTKIG